MSGVLFQKSLGVERGHAAGACAGDGLAVYMVLDIAGGKRAGHAGLGGKALVAAVGDDVEIIPVASLEEALEALAERGGDPL